MPPPDFVARILGLTNGVPDHADVGRTEAAQGGAGDAGGPPLDEAGSTQHMRPWRGSAALVLCMLVAAGAAVTHAQDQPVLPAGAQFLGEPESLPDGFLVRDIAERDGTIVVLGSMDVGARDVGVVGAAVRAPDGIWSTVTVDDLRGYRGPKGLSDSDGFLPAGLAAGPDGFVAIGRAGFIEDCGDRCSTQGQDGQVQSLLWHSPDGRTWTRIELRDILGGKTTAALQAVMATPDGGWIVVGSSASTDFRHPSKIVVLTSSDGLEWRRSATIGGSRSLEATALHQVGEVTVLEGVELVCLRDSVHHSLAGAMANGDTVGGFMRPLRLWQSDAAARDWRPVDPTASGVIKAPRRTSFSRRDCATTDFQSLDRLSGSGAILGATGGQLVAIPDDRTRASVSSDLEHWTVAELPGAVPGGDPPEDRQLGAVAVATDTGGVTLLSLEARRDAADDSVIPSDRQVLAWTTGDDGTTWSRLPAARPLLVGSPPGLTQLSPDRVALVSGPSRLDGGSIRFSEAGALAPWGTCQPAAGADCGFATIDIDLPGADLSGITLDGARVGYSDWSGADLRGASMRDASIWASLAGADLRDADMVGAGLNGDLSGANVGGADMRGASVDLDILAGDTAGTKLAGASFQVPDARPDGIQLMGRDLDLASFWGHTTAWVTCAASTSVTPISREWTSGVLT